MSWALNTRTSDSGRKHDKRSRLPDVMLSSSGQYTWNLAQIVEEEEPITDEMVLD